MDVVETYKFTKKHSLIFHNSYLKLSIERYEIKDNKKNIVVYFSLYKYKYDKWILIEFFELRYIQDNESEYTKTKYCNIRIKEFYFESNNQRKWVIIVDIICNLYHKEKRRLENTTNIDSRFNPNESKLEKINILLIKPYNTRQEELINKYLLDSIQKKDLFNESILNSGDEKRNPFLVFSQLTNYYKSELSLDQIDGKGRYSWDLPMESPIFKFLRYLQGSYYLFLYPFRIQNRPNASANTTITKFIISRLNIDIDNIYVDQYGTRNQYALYIGVLFLKNLMECIIEYTPSDISYLQIIFNNSIEDCIKLINETLSLFRIMFKEMNPGLIETDLLFTSKKDLEYLDMIIKKYSFNNKFDEIQLIIMNTWCVIFSHVNKEYPEYSFKDTLDFDKMSFNTTRINNRYFYNYYLSNFNDDYLPTIIYKNYFDTLRINGLLIKEVNELYKVSNLRDMVSIQNIVNILRLKNFNRCIVLYNDITIQHFESLLSSSSSSFVVSQNSPNIIKLYDTQKTKNENIFVSLGEYLNLYLLFEHIDYFLYRTEFNEFEENDITENIENPEIPKLQYFSPLIFYYGQNKVVKEEETDYNYIGLYILLLFLTNSPSYTHILDNDNVRYIKSNSPVVQKFMEIIINRLKIDSKMFSNINMTREIGYHFRLIIVFKNGTEESSKTIIDFVTKLINQKDNVKQIK